MLEKGLYAEHNRGKLHLSSMITTRVKSDLGDTIDLNRRAQNGH